MPSDSRYYMTAPAYKPKVQTLPLDINAISQLKIPESEESKPRSFENSHALFKMDKYQQEAVNAYTSGKSTIVSAPTGTGKTLIAEYAIKDALDKGKKMIYTSPLKALSNEKYSDLAKLFGEYDQDGNLISADKVGLLTGDVSINPDAPLLVMTTEVYRNSLLTVNSKAAKEQYKDYDGVIYDEFHYLGEKERGTVWEEAVMYTPEHMKQLMLSATASNAQKIQEWVADINPKIETCLINVPESERHVPLREFIMTENRDGSYGLEKIKEQRIPFERITHPESLTDRQKQAYNEMKVIIGYEKTDDIISYFKDFGQQGKVISADIMSKGLKSAGAEVDKAEAISLILSDDIFTKYKTYADGEFISHPKMSKVVDLLHRENIDPALIYIFSKKGCNREFEYAAEYGQSLLKPEESKRVYDEIKKAQDKGVHLGADFDQKEMRGLMKGYAVHHAGKLPAYKSLVENLARQGLVKVCFATETLIAGINMPFKTTVFTRLDKYTKDDGGSFVDITTSCFKQGAGRAGRRGKDEIGNVIVIPQNEDCHALALHLSGSKDTSIISQENPEYSSCLSDRMLNCNRQTLEKSLAAHQSRIKSEAYAKLVKARFDILEKFGYIKQEPNGKYSRTDRGETAKNVFGVNEIILTELLHNPEYFKDLNSDEIIAICASFADVKDDNPAGNFSGGLSYLNPEMAEIRGVADTVDNAEIAACIRITPTPMSTNLAPAIVEYANAPSDRNSALLEWDNIMKDLIGSGLIAHEGDFLRVVNGTIDILRMVAELSPYIPILQLIKKQLFKTNLIILFYLYH